MIGAILKIAAEVAKRSGPALSKAGKGLKEGAKKAYDWAKKKLGKEAPKKPCKNCKQTRQDIENEANVKKTTKGKTKIGEKPGGFNQANKDFDKLQPTDVQTKQTPYGQGRFGKLDNGDTVFVRPGSTDGRPTLEFRNPSNGRGSEIRYNP